jgi:hypothetical protein
LAHGLFLKQMLAREVHTLQLGWPAREVHTLQLGWPAQNMQTLQLGLLPQGCIL